MNIHPTAVVDPSAELGEDVEIGPFSVVEAGVRIGPRCRLAARTSVKRGVTMGADNVVAEGAVLGGLPQHASPPGPPGDAIIGDRNIFRENTTVHRPMHADGVTRIGSDCMLMACAHVAHDCVVADRVVLTNNVMLGGHVTVGERAFLGGGSAIHQHCRVGRVAMVGGMARVPQDVPPFTMIDGASNLVVGLNRVGLRRAGLTRPEMAELKEAYQIIYRSGLSFEKRMETLAERFPGGPASEFEPFLRDTSRGFTRERRAPPGGTIRAIDSALDPATHHADTRRAG